VQIVGRVGGHESFPPRYGWLKKGFDAVLKDPGIFSQDYAIVELGVGKNMVRSIRYWCQACKVIETGERGKMVPTSFGWELLSNNGWDPYLEDLATCWLLHWKLFTPPVYAVGWPLAFNASRLDFDVDELGAVMRRVAQEYPRLATISANSYRREASCMIRMYAEGREDWDIVSPFVELELMRRVDRGRVVFEVDTRYSLPPLIFVAACFDYAQHHLAPGQRSISLRRLVYGPNSPGVAFKMTETEAGRYLSDAADSMEGFSIVEVIGDTQLHLEAKPSELLTMALSKHYGVDGAVGGQSMTVPTVDEYGQVAMLF